MPQEEKAISSRELISAERVMELWSVSDDELVEEIKRGKFVVLFCSKKPRQSPNGEILLVCWEGTYKNIYYHNDFPHNEDTYYDFSNVYFYAIDISGHQIQFPHLTMPTTESDQVKDKCNGQINNYISFEDMQNLSELSIVQLGKIVQGKNLAIYYKDRDGMDIERMKPFDISVNGFQNWLADEGFFDIRDLIPMKDALVELKLFFENKNISLKSSVAEELKKNCPNAQRRIAELERQLQEMRQENERLKAGGNEVESSIPDCATCRADSQHSDEWAKDVEYAVSLTVQLMIQGERGSTAYHEAEWKALRGGTRKKAFEAIRRALPAHLKETDPRQK